MNRWECVVLSIAIALATGCAHGARTYSRLWQLRGAVVSVSETVVQVRHKSGQIVQLQIDDHTVFVHNKRSDSWRSLLRGTRVIVDVETLQRGLYHARRVQIFGGGRPW